MSHFDKLVRLPEGFMTIASTKNAEFAGIAHQSKPIFGLYFHRLVKNELIVLATGIQLHPEISHTARGTDILGNFALGVCGARADWEMESFTEKEIIRIRKLVGDTAQVVCVSSYSSRKVTY